MDLANDQLTAEYQRLTKLQWDRALNIEKRRKSRHEKVNFDNPNFNRQLQELEQEMKNRGLK